MLQYHSLLTFVFLSVFWATCCSQSNESNKVVILTQDDLRYSISTGYLYDPVEHNVTSPEISPRNYRYPPSFDYRTDYKYNVVTDPESQLGCYSCWSFGFIYMLESQYAIKTGKLISLSKQEIIDCSRSYRCDTWGSLKKAASFYKQNKLMSTEDYGPFLGADGTCNYDPNKGLLSVDGGLITFSGHDHFLYYLYQRGPIAATMILPHKYVQGIWTLDGKQCPKKEYPPNHTVLIVGYGISEAGLKYWIIKQTYGLNFAVNGYNKVERGRNTLCIEDYGAIAKIKIYK